MSANEELSGSGGVWIEWGGGKQPMADGVAVEVKLRNGMQYTESSDELRWSTRNDRDIIAYRIVGA